MAQKRSVTPEKQLLSLIENSDSKPASAGSKTFKYRSLSFLSPGAWIGRLAFLKDRFKRRSLLSRPTWVDIKVLNNGLAVCLGMLLIYFAGVLVSSSFGMRRFPMASAKTQDAIKLSIFPDLEPLKAGPYLEKIRQRDIFKIGARPRPRPTEEAPRASVSTALEATKNLKLVGISWSRDPDAMIENTEALKTFFVKKGRMIGEVRVREIMKDKVILEYQGQEVELK